MGRDELCLICGISPAPPSEFRPTKLSVEALYIVGRMLKCDPLVCEDLGIHGGALEEMIEGALFSEPKDQPRMDSSERSWKSFKNAIAIGHFNHKGETPYQDIPQDSGWLTRIPDGADVETRVVRKRYRGNFYSIVHRTTNEDGSGVTETEEAQPSITTSKNHQEGIGNFWISEGCYHYARAWVDFSSLPKATWHARALSFSGELYEIMNSRERGRVRGIGTFPEISYDGIERTLDERQYDYHGGMNLPTEIVAAIRRGASPEELHSAVIKDCRCWMFYPPDIWPTLTNDQHEQYTHFASAPSTGLGTLSTFPPEILSQCLSRTDTLHSYLALSQASKPLWNLLTEPAYFNHTLREMAARPSNCLFWLRPVDTLLGEGEKAKRALANWLPTSEHPTPDNMPNCLLDHPAFPYLNFLRACYASDSMMNRKRLWGQIKQLEVIWKDYRVNGWRVDRFGVPLQKDDE